MQSSDDTSDGTGTCSNDSFPITVDSHATTEYPHTEEPDQHHHPEKAEEPTKDDVYANAVENPPTNDNS